MAIASQIIAVVVLGTWGRGRLASTFGRGDIVFHVALVRSMQLTGGYSAGPNLGAPNGQDMADFPLGGDHLHLAALRLLAELPMTAVSIVNLYYLLSFGLIALLAHVTLRSLGSDAWPAAGASILFAFVPYHFAHGPSHLFLSMYVAVPLAVLLAVWVADGRLSWRNPPWRYAVAGLCVLVVGCGSAYYAVFGAISIAAAAALGSVRARSLRPLLVGMAVAVAIAFVLVANLVPTLAHRGAEGEDIEVAQRTTLASEVYGLRPAALVVPEATHRIPAFSRRGLDLNAVPFPGELGSYLGVAGVLGLVVLLGACFAGLGDVKVPPVMGLLGAMFLVMLLVGARGGGGFVLALAGFTDIRAWGRTSLTIALLSLGALALAGTTAARRIGTPAVAVATTLLVVVGLFDQIPAEPTPGRAAELSATQQEERLITEMEQALPEAATVYQLPYIRFPEAGPILRMVDYDSLRPYVLGRGRLRWSHGGIRGRSADWQEPWAAQPAPVLLRAVAAAGFSALWIDGGGYPDGGDALHREVAALTGAASQRSPDGRLAWYDLRPFAERTRAELGPEAEATGRGVTSIPRAVWAQGFDPISGGPPGPRLADDGAVLDLRSSTGREQAAVLLLSVDVPTGVTVSVETTQGSWRSAGSGSQDGRLALQLGKGHTLVRFRVEGAKSVGFRAITPLDATAVRLLDAPVAAVPAAP